MSADMHGGRQGLAVLLGCDSGVCACEVQEEISGQYVLLYPSMSCRLVYFVCSPEECVSRVMGHALVALSRVRGMTRQR